MAHRWGMAIDLDKCTGCEACITACHAENNIPSVAPEQAGRGRAMHWLRVERYYEGDFPDVRVKFRPVLCQQCDNAPCEAVCPTYASHRGVNPITILAPTTIPETGTLAWAATRVKIARVGGPDESLILFGGATRERPDWTHGRGDEH